MKNEDTAIPAVTDEPPPKVVIHKVHVAPMPVIDYVEKRVEKADHEYEPSIFIEAETGQSVPIPRQLFGSMWLEGDIAVMLGERASGKSLLAVQMAESIARGKPFTPEITETGDKKELGGDPALTQHVLYLDLVLDRTQFAMRYSLEPRPGDTDLRGCYQFSKRFHRFQIDLTIDRPDEPRRMQQFLLRQIEELISSTGATVVVIDSIERLSLDIMRARDLAYVMNGLRRIRANHKVSILIVSELSRRSQRQPLEPSRLLATRYLCGLADSVFCIGVSRGDENCRYIKHFRSAATEMLYDGSRVPTFRIVRGDGNFPALDHLYYADESVLLDPYADASRQKRSDEAKELKAKGMSQRRIAREMNISLTSVNRALTQWSPWDERSKVTRPTKLAQSAEHLAGKPDPADEKRSIVTNEEAAYWTRRYMESIGLAGNREKETTTMDPGVNSSTPPGDGKYRGYDFLARCKPGYDDHNREIFIEKQGCLPGRIAIAYRFVPSGDLLRVQDNGHGIFKSTMPSPQDLTDPPKPTILDPKPPADESV